MNSVQWQLRLMYSWYHFVNILLNHQEWDNLLKSIRLFIFCCHQVSYILKIDINITTLIRRHHSKRHLASYISTETVTLTHFSLILLHNRIHIVTHVVTLKCFSFTLLFPRISSFVITILLYMLYSYVNIICYTIREMHTYISICNLNRM